MSTTLIVILAAVAAVALFVVGLSLTLMIKGRHIDSEIGDNENMKRLGIRCAAREGVEAQGGKSADCLVPDDCDPAGCGTCASSAEVKK